MANRSRALHAPFLRSIRWRDDVRPKNIYPFNLPIFKDAEFELVFTNPVTILVGENATHAPLLMALPGATLLHLTQEGIAEVNYRTTPHFQMMAQFFADLDRLVANALTQDADE